MIRTDRAIRSLILRRERQMAPVLWEAWAKHNFGHAALCDAIIYGDR